MFGSLSVSGGVLLVFLFVSAFCNVLLFIDLIFVVIEGQDPSPPPPRPAPQFSYPKIKENPLRSRQILFVGGVPRSGTTLTRSMLDAHPDIHCGEETRVIPNILGLRAQLDMKRVERERIEAAHISSELLDRATASVVTEILLHHGPSVEYVCNKDPLVLAYTDEVLRMFPKSKFVLLIRDGRAVAYSIVSRNVTIAKVDTTSYLESAKFWNKAARIMLANCEKVGADHCLQVRYEELVQDPRTWMERILEFGGIPWHENVLHHHELIGTEVSLSETEKSTSQVKEPVNTDAIDKWRTKIPAETLKTIYEECDMLEKLGYEPA